MELYWCFWGQVTDDSNFASVDLDNFRFGNFAIESRLAAGVDIGGHHLDGKKKPGLKRIENQVFG